MVNKILTVIGLALVVAGAAVAAATGFELAQLTGLAVTMFGAGLAAASLWKEREGKGKSWVNVLVLVLVTAGAFILGLTGVLSESAVTTVIGCVVSIVLIIAGIITGAVTNKGGTNDRKVS